MDSKRCLYASIQKNEGMLSYFSIKSKKRYKKLSELSESTINSFCNAEKCSDDKASPVKKGRAFIESAAFSERADDAQSRRSDFINAEDSVKGFSIYNDELRLRKLKKICTRTKESWEIDSFYHNAPVAMDKDGKSFFPAVMLIADVDLGMTIGDSAVHIMNHEEEFLSFIMEFMGKMRTIPKRVIMKDQKLALYMSPLLERLGVKVETRARLNLIPQAKRDYLEDSNQSGTWIF
ncbi:hypothetical protein SAMN02745945_00335 [Peptoclostridium litorale DSM 5388]|uniref:DUF6930 domain-containing protein n=1 Tax=Peptoclostridium litorale DSM 5388 TaxID=1121324 RepID=A0A069RHA1_PEPLI|nr:hypothetical protein [Peptoclostridium litorale]KDR96424.1 hypothetical protein CLIT_2c00300 [Peptoclostridium litorale DSM 5388]SIN70752.1 hypothetical protein SAMN02745945_00335 [Peptoclostridium litorale DSM 5388]